MLDVNNVCAGYDGKDVIRNISFRADRGERLCVLGPNGCGKSTLLKSIARIIEYRGGVTLDSHDTALCSRGEFAKKIALLGQSGHVFFPYTVYETVAMGRYAHSRRLFGELSPEDTDIIDTVIKHLDLGDIRGRMIDALSGGQLQRVFLARTLAQMPEVILLDEPTNHLDLKYQIELMRYVQSWVKKNNTIFIGVFHDLNLARYCADTALVMSNGELVLSGTAARALRGDTLRKVYGMDIRGFMLESLEKWKE